MLRLLHSQISHEAGFEAVGAAKFCSKCMRIHPMIVKHLEQNLAL